MKSTVRFAVAKYVPDLHRMEPRNLGIVLWMEGGGVAARFLGESEDGLSFQSPAIVEKGSRYAYREWIRYWRHQLGASEIVSDSGEAVPKSSPSFFDALLGKSKEQFRLVDCGHFTEKLSGKELPEAMKEMFVRLVEKPQAERTHAEQTDLKEYCKQLMETVELPMQHNLPVPRFVLGVLRNFTVDYAWGPIARPNAVLQRVLLTRGQSIDSNAFMFQALTTDATKAMPKEHCAALVNASQPLDEEGRTGLKMLANVATVIDVSKMSAVKQIQELAARTGTQAL